MRTSRAVDTSSIVQDVRGRGDSDGNFDFFFAEADDGYDTVEWVAEQPWSNGRVCMMGVSYLGTVQWLAARERPPHLVCIAPTAPGGIWFDEAPYNGGAFMMQFALGWANGVSGRISQDNAAMVDWEKVLWHRPLLTMDEVMGRRMPMYRDWLENPTINDYWKRILFAPDDFRNMDLPALTVTGWFDGDQPGAMSYWDGMAAHSPARDQQYLVVGPWTHVQTFFGGALEVGEMKFSGESVLDNNAIHLAFFDRYLKGTGEDYDEPRAKVYVTGSNTWREFTAYPPPEARAQRMYLHSGGQANSLVGDGTLSWTTPSQESQDAYTYDPHNPVPSSIGGAAQAIDRRPIQRRDDVLVYTSDVLDAPLDVIGSVTVELHAATDARDTDFTAVISDVYPDGRAVSLGTNDRYHPGPIPERLRADGTGDPGTGREVRDQPAGHRPHVFCRVTGSESISRVARTRCTTPTKTRAIQWRQTPNGGWPIRSSIMTGNHPSAIVLPVVPSKPVS